MINHERFLIRKKSSGKIYWDGFYVPSEGKLGVGGTLKPREIGKFLDKIKKRIEKINGDPVILGEVLRRIDDLHQKLTESVSSGSTRELKHCEVVRQLKVCDEVWNKMLLEVSERLGKNMKKAADLLRGKGDKGFDWMKSLKKRVRREVRIWGKQEYRSVWSRGKLSVIDSLTRIQKASDSRRNIKIRRRNLKK